MNKDLVIIITGATSGIGKTTSEYLASLGYCVYSIARRTYNDTEKIKYLSCDITDENQVKDCIKKVIAKEGHLDVLINNAGIGISGAIEYQDNKDIDKIIDVNLKGTINVTKNAIPYLREAKGKIINIGSIAGELAIPFQTMYSSTKSAIHIFSLALANELKPFGIKVTCVMPGDTKTSFTQNRQKEVKNTYYQDRITNSIKRMENDETHGDDPVKVSKVIYSCIKSKNPPLKKAVDKKYSFLLFIKRFLGDRLINRILYNMYGK